MKKEKVKIKTVAIIGVGLIGGSLGLALKSLKKYKIIGVGRDLSKLKYALKCGAVDEIYVNFEDGVKNADVVVIAAPVMTYSDIADKIKPFLKKNAVVFDVGSTKLEVTNLLTEKLGNNFVGVHPIAGSEKTGIKYSRADLFKNTICVLTPLSKTNKKAVKIVKDIMVDAGVKIIQMSPLEHDMFLALTSHLPHITAISLVQLLGQLENERPLVKFLVGNGFKDTTRIGAGSPEVWIDICKTNKENLIDVCNKMLHRIIVTRNLLQKEDWKSLYTEFEKAKIIRESLSNGTITN